MHFVLTRFHVKTLQLHFCEYKVCHTLQDRETGLQELLKRNCSEQIMRKNCNLLETSVMGFS